MAINPQYTSNPRSESVEISTANANRDGTGSITNLITAQGEIGTLINQIIVKAQATTTLGMIRIFKRTGTGTWFLFDEIQVTAITPSASVKTFNSVYEFNQVLKTGDSLGVSTHNAEIFDVHCFGGDF